jgi:uncharacterized protein
VNGVLDTAIENIVSPMMLFFALGVIAARLGSDLSVPEAIAKGTSLYLLMSIGLRGGGELTHGEMGSNVLPTIGAAVALSTLLPVVAYALLRAGTRTSAIDAASIAAHYGSVSVVTFVTATGFLAQVGVPYEGHLVAAMAVMEVPAIITGIVLAQLGREVSQTSTKWNAALAQEIFASGSIILLLGSLTIGWATGARGAAAVAPFFDAPFKGVLCLFLLDMGILTARRMPRVREIGLSTLAFGVYMPIVGALVGLAMTRLLDLSVGGATLFVTLAASASYIVVPAAMRLALPQANPSVAVALALGVTFPWNLVVGIPTYFAAVRALHGQ